MRKDQADDKGEEEDEEEEEEKEEERVVMAGATICPISSDSSNSNLTTPSKKFPSFEGKSDQTPQQQRQERLALLHARLRELENENLRLLQHQQQAAVREEKAKEEVETLRASLLSHSLAGEVEALKREQQLKDQLAEVSKRLVAAEKKGKAGEGVREEMAMLQDELDLIRPTAEKLALTEEALGKAKTKLQDLRDVRERLMEEQAAHAEAVETSLKYERELQQLPALKRQIETLKAGATDTELTLRELQAALAEDEALKQKQQLEIHALRQTLAVTSLRGADATAFAAALEGGGRGGGWEGGGEGGVGGGFSECNPEVVRRMRALEAEVEGLRGQVSETAVARVESLEEEKDAQKRLAESFEERYRKTKAELTTRTQEWEVVKEGNATLHEQLKMVKAKAATEGKRLRDSNAAISQALTEAQHQAEMSQEELQQRVHHQEKVMRRAHEEMEARAWLASLGMKALLRKLTDETGRLKKEGEEGRKALGETTGRLVAAEHCVLLLKKEGEAAAVAAAAAVAHATAEGEKRVGELYAQAQAHVLDMERKQAEVLQRLEEEMKRYSEGHAVSNEEHHAQIQAGKRALEVARKEAEALGEEVEEGRMVRLRMEKEKSFLVEEAQSLRKELALRQGSWTLHTHGSSSSSSSTLTGTAAMTTGPGMGQSAMNNLSRAELEKHYEKLQKEYAALLQDHRRQQAGIQLAESSIGFCLDDFSHVEGEEEREGGVDGIGLYYGEEKEEDASLIYPSLIEEDEEEEEEEGGGDKGERASGGGKPGTNTRRLSLRPAGRVGGGRGRGRGGLQHDFDTVAGQPSASSSLTPTDNDGRGGSGGRGAVGGRRTMAGAGAAAAGAVGGGMGGRSRGNTLFTPPERVPFVAVDGFKHQIQALINKNRGLVAEGTAATATIHRLEGELAALKGVIGGKEDEIGSLHYQMARLGRQVDKLTAELAGGGKERGRAEGMGMRKENT